MKFIPFDPYGHGLDLSYEKDVSYFVRNTEDHFKYASKNKRKVLALMSGGVDSTACGLLAHRALGASKFNGVHFEHGFMREGECKEVLWDLNSRCNIPVTYRDLSKEFLPRVIDAGKDAEEKRKAVSETYFEVARKLANEFDADIILHGTIRPDWEETEGGIKTQHNVVTERWKKRFEDDWIMVAEPLYYLYKPDSRNILRYFNMPSSVSERQPFPGPGLAVRDIGQVSENSLGVLRKLDSIVTSGLEPSMKVYRDQGKDVQYFAALMDARTENVEIPSECSGIKISNPRVAKDKVTGMVENKRTYKSLLLFNSKPEYPIPIEPFAKASCEIIEKNKDIGRCAVVLRERDEGDYIALARAITTKNFKTAEVAEPPASFVHITANQIMNAIPQIRTLAYDVTPKPPATIEFE